VWCVGPHDLYLSHKAPKSSHTAHVLGGCALVSRSELSEIGWSWSTRPHRGYELITVCTVSAEADPEPAMASKLQHQNALTLFFRSRVSRSVHDGLEFLSVNQGREG